MFIICTLWHHAVKSIFSGCPVVKIEQAGFQAVDIAEVGAAIAKALTFKAPTQQEFNTITRRTTRRMQRQLLAVNTRYDRRSERVIITLNTGVVVGFPLPFLQGLEQAKLKDLRKIEVEGGGYGLHVAGLDADISVPSLLEDHLGSLIMKLAISGRCFKSKWSSGR